MSASKLGFRWACPSEKQLRGPISQKTNFHWSRSSATYVLRPTNLQQNRTKLVWEGIQLVNISLTKIVPVSKSENSVSSLSELSCNHGLCYCTSLQFTNFAGSLLQILRSFCAWILSLHFISASEKRNHYKLEKADFLNGGEKEGLNGKVLQG